MVKNIFLSIWLIFTCIFVDAQKIQLKGKVIDNESKKAIAFAYVKLENKPIGTVTNENGVFDFTISDKEKNDNLKISYLGYKNLIIPISKITNQDNIVLKLSVSPSELDEIVVKAAKLPKAKTVLKKAINAIPNNFANNPTNLEAYYREIVSENGQTIKFSDATCKYYYTGYDKKSYGYGDYDYGRGSVSSLSSFYAFGGASLHRSHFHWLTGKDDQVKIIDARASSSLSQKRMNSSIEGGPLGLLAKDKVKFRASMFDKKKLDAYDFTIKLKFDDAENEYYQIKYKTNTSIEKLEELFQKKGDKHWKLANKNKLLEGEIHIDKNSLAILYFHCRVPNEYKKYFCSFKAMQIKHFAYEVKAYYKKIGNKYYVDKIWQEDEFIYKDTIQNTVIPYSAVSEVFINKVETDSVIKFKKSEHFANLAINQLYDYPISYNENYWVNFTRENPQFKIPKKVRNDMEKESTLEAQFAAKHIRDDNMQPPIALKIPDTTFIHNDTLIDNYSWLKDTKAPLHNEKVMNYIDEENKYADNHFKPLRNMQRHIFKEFMNRTEKNYESLPTKLNGYYYHYSYTEDQEYPVYFRNKIGSKTIDTLLDVNKMAKKRDRFYSAGNIIVSPNNQLMAFYENTTGSDSYVLKFKNLTSDKILTDSLSGIVDVVWLNDTVLLYTKQEEKTYRPYKLMKHNLFQPQKDDKTLFTEKDPEFRVYITKTQSRKFVQLYVSSSETSECYFIDLNDPEQKLNLIEPRKHGHSYTFNHFKNDFYILSNQNSVNYSLFKTSVKQYKINNWKKIINGQDDVLITDFTLFDNYLVISEKEKAQPRIKVIDLSINKSHFVKFKEDVYEISLFSNPDMDTKLVRLVYSSPITPQIIYDYNMETKELTEIKKQIVQLMPWKNSIKVERVWATARDGAKIPITLYYYKYFFRDKRFAPQKLFLTSYGSYGVGMDASYSPTPYILINKGFVYAIAHIRGGDDLGNQWHDDGKMMNKKNTFADFIDCAEYLTQEKYVEPGQIVAQGGSAGGLLMGAVANMRPDLFKMIILDVPFVDVVNTMLDKDLPLTTLEFSEWGNPKIKSHYDYIKSYSPYENVKKQEYPNMLFMTGLNDSRVGYWEPAKMVAKLRDYKTDNNKLLLKTELYSGHGGNSGRYSYYRSLAYKYAIILDIFEKERPLNKYEKD